MKLMQMPMVYKFLAFTAVAVPMACHGGVALRGAVGAKADALFERRLTSATARGDIFNEAVRIQNEAVDFRNEVVNKEHLFHVREMLLPCTSDVGAVEV